MNRQQPLILIDSPEIVSSGLWPDRHPGQTPLWVVAQNVTFRGGKITRRLPNAPMFDAGAQPIRGLGQHQDSGGTRYVYAMEGPNLRRWFGPAPTLLGTFANFVRDATGVGNEASFYDLVPWGNWMLINNRRSGLYRWWPGRPSGTDFDILPNAPTDAVAVLKKRNQLIAVGHGLNSHLVTASDADDIENWDINDPETLAVEVPIEELDTPVRSACHFGKSIAIFGENQLFSFDWIGAPFYYAPQKLLDGIGSVGKMATCSDGRILYGVSRTGCWRSDGLQYNYIDEVVLHDYLQENINWAQASKIVVEKNDYSGCIEFSFPMRGSLDNNEAWSYDPRYNGWSQVPFFEMMQRRILFDKPIQGQVDGNVQLIESFPTDPIAKPLALETTGLLMQRDNNTLHLGGLIDEIELYAKKADGVQMRYGVAEKVGGDYTWSEWKMLVPDMKTYQTGMNISGVWHKLQFQSVVPDWSFDLQGFAMFGVPEGQKKDD